MKNLFLTLLFCMVALCAIANDHAPVANRPDWMKDLKDDTPIWKLSIPGVHDGATGSSHSYGASVQTKNILQLFDAGVRAFDIRIGFTSGIELRIYHGGLDMARTFKGVMDDIYESLKKHPTEFVIALINIEHATTQHENCMEHMRAYFNFEGDRKSKYHSSEDDYLADKSKWLTFKPDMTIGEARGHVLFVFRDDYTDIEKMMGARLGTFSSDPKVSTIKYYDHKNKVEKTVQFLCQDADNNDNLERTYDTKINYYVRPCIDSMTVFVNRNETTWCINHLSCWTHDPCIPNSAGPAQVVNREFSKYLVAHPEVYTGIVMMDYAAEYSSWGYVVSGDIALDAVIHHNWRFWKDPEKDPLGHVEVVSN